MNLIRVQPKNKITYVVSNTANEPPNDDILQNHIDLMNKDFWELKSISPVHRYVSMGSGYSIQGSAFACVWEKSSKYVEDKFYSNND